MLNKKELELYKKLLLDKKSKLLSGVRSLEKMSLHETSQGASGDLSSYATHPADIASDNYEQAKNLDFMDNLEVFLEDVEDALSKIENKTYGKCEKCKKVITEGRLKVEPHARLCMECKEKEEYDNKK